MTTRCSTGPTNSTTPKIIFGKCLHISNNQSILLPHTYCIDAVSVGSDPQAAAAGPHGRDQGPLVEIWVVAFSCGEASMPVITPANIHLQTGLRMLHLIYIPLQLQSK